ncbi:MAG: restriction endonuclease subunit S, partial [Ectothiorhodospiraceae bacterium]|nr:restriction endonuclease subunit S [Ectothiorhodospiraceae bacterium]
GKYAAYPEYKDSGVEWLGDTPTHWGAKPLKFLCTYNDEVLADSVSDDYEIEYVDIGSVSATEGVTKTESMVFGKAPSRARRIVRDGDVIISTVRTYLEAIAPIDNPPENLVVSTGFAVIRPNRLLHKGYAAYCLRASGFIKEVVAQSVGISYPAINASDLVNIKAPEPMFDEQEKIAKFLDHETAKIDTLIEKQQQLIKLLKEKRQAVISHAVTKGLNPNAPLRDSGVEWLGEVPEHWTPLQIRRVLPVMEQGKSPDCENKVAEVHEWGVLKTSCVNNGVYNSDANKTLPNEIAPFPQYEVKNGDILMSRASGSINLIGSVAYVYETRPKILLSDKVFRLHLSSQVNRLFFSYVMRSSFMRSNIGRAISGAEGMANNITKGAVIGFRFALPPLKEQEAITGFISEKVNKLDELVLKSKFAIELIKERRTALISAAVTGKIDVRGWVAPVPPSARDAAQNNQQAAT